MQTELLLSSAQHEASTDSVTQLLLDRVYLAKFGRTICGGWGGATHGCPAAAWGAAGGHLAQPGSIPAATEDSHHLLNLHCT